MCDMTRASKIRTENTFEENLRVTNIAGKLNGTDWGGLDMLGEN